MLRPTRSSPLVAVSALLLGLSVTTAFAEKAEKNEGPPPPDQSAVRVIGSDGKPVPPPEPGSEVERYCSAIADPAREARIAVQQKKLKDLEAQVDARIDELEKKRADYQTWLKERQVFLDSVSDTMLNIYAKMKPDAAAAQLAAVDRPTAAALLVKLNARTASAILAEMSAPIAAELGNLIVEKTTKTPDGAMAGLSKG
ncbi:MotE family protein [Aureimonas endophytica]|nr:MotE family protein [Aureimonas endophytica]